MSPIATPSPSPMEKRMIVINAYCTYVMITYRLIIHGHAARAV